MKKILIIDDSTADRLIVKEILQGYEIIEAKNGSVGIEIIKRADIDLVITDQYMEPINGLEAIKEMLKIKPDLRCIVITAHESVKLAVTGFRVGAVDFISKPINALELIEVVERNITKK